MANISFKRSFKGFAIHQHDEVCNQKYNKTLPYSFHLDCVVKNAEVYFDADKYQFNKQEAIYAAIGHDLIEDARVTFNDILEALKDDAILHSNSELYGNVFIRDHVVAEAILGCTESVGRNRAERHDAAYFNRLMNAPLDLGVFVKLCDIMANVKFSLLTQSSMYQKYKREFPHFVQELKDYGKLELFKNMVDDLEKLLSF